MKYSIQTRYGEVFGIFDAPETVPPITPKEFAKRLSEQLKDEPAVSTIEPTALPVRSQNGDYVHVDRLVVTIDTISIKDSFDLENIHVAVGMVSLLQELGQA